MTPLSSFHEYTDCAETEANTTAAMQPAPRARRSEARMYSINHPRIACVRDVARCVLARAGIQAVYDDALPQDNLANGPIFPVYPEIGARLGVQGSLLFKLGGAYRFLRLADYVEASFRLYRDHDGITIRNEHAALQDAAMTLIGRHA